jgi:hypothetical protein
LQTLEYIHVEIFSGRVTVFPKFLHPFSLFLRNQGLEKFENVSARKNWRGITPGGEIPVSHGFGEEKLVINILTRLSIRCMVVL